MQTLLILLGYVVYFFIVIAYVSKTCDVNEYLSNAGYRKAVFNQIDVPLLLGLIAAIALCFILHG